MTRAFKTFIVLTLIVSFTLLTLVFLGQSSSRKEIIISTILAAPDTLIASSPQIVGSEKCRMCHMDIYKSWQSTAHSRATSVLTAQQKTDDNCMACHSTGHDKKGKLVENVGCESCHGPGSQYRKMRIMKDRVAAMKSGLVLPGESDCVECHNSSCPEFELFDFETFFENGTHLMPNRQAVTE
jgi:hypothetical protein